MRHCSRQSNRQLKTTAKKKVNKNLRFYVKRKEEKKVTNALPVSVKQLRVSFSPIFTEILVAVPLSWWWRTPFVRLPCQAPRQPNRRASSQLRFPMAPRDIRHELRNSVGCVAVMEVERDTGREKERDRKNNRERVYNGKPRRAWTCNRLRRSHVLLGKIAGAVYIPETSTGWKISWFYMATVALRSNKRTRIAQRQLGVLRLEGMCEKPTEKTHKNRNLK